MMMRDYFSSIPNDVLNYLLSFMEFESLCKLFLVSKRFNLSLQGDTHWKQICEQAWKQNDFSQDLHFLVSKSRELDSSKGYPWLGRCLQNKVTKEELSKSIGFSTKGQFGRMSNPNSYHQIVCGWGIDFGDSLVRIGRF